MQDRLEYFYQSFSRIPVAFGFDHIDAKEIIRNCYEKAEHDPYRVKFSHQLVKAVVKECIHRLSISYFQDASNLEKPKRSCLNYSITGSEETHMPLPYKAVYILKKQGYPKPEIADLLNTNVVTVTQHLALAQRLMEHAA